MRLGDWIILTTILDTACVFSRKQTLQTECKKKDYHPCDNNWHYIETTNEKKCVFIERYHGMGDFANGRFSCEPEAILVEIYNAEFNQKLFDLLQRPEYKGKRYYWIGLRDDQGAGAPRWRNRRNIPVPYENYKSAPKNTPNTCYTIDARNGKWDAIICDKGRNFICMKGTFTDKANAPSLDVQVDSDPNIMFTGNNVTAICRGFVGTLKTLSFLLTEGSKKEEVWYNDTRIKTVEAYKVRYGICSKYMTSQLDLEVRKARRTPRLSCVLHLPRAKKLRCSKTGCKGFQLVFKDKNASPSLNVHYHGEGSIVHLHRPLLSTCSACLGPEGQLSWSINRDFKTDRLQEDDPRIISSTQEPKNCGTLMQSSLLLPIGWHEEDITISCSSVNNKSDTSPTAHTIAETSPRLVLKFGPQTPELEVDYHAEPSDLVLGWNLTANCTACVGSYGKVSWDVIDEDNDTLTDKDSDALMKWERKTEQEPDYWDEVCKCRVTSYIFLHVIRALQGARLVCYTYNGTYPDGYVVTAESLPFRIPDFRPHHHDYHSNLHLKELLIGLFCFLFLILALILLRRCLLNGGYIQKSNKKVDRRREAKGKNRPGMTKKAQIDAKPVVLSNQSLGTDVDTGKGRKGPRNSRELAKQLKITVLEARRRILAFKKIELAKLQKTQRGKGVQQTGVMKPGDGAAEAALLTAQEKRRTVQMVMRASTMGVPVDVPSSETLTTLAAGDSSTDVSEASFGEPAPLSGSSAPRVSVPPRFSMWNTIFGASNEEVQE